MLLGDDLVLLRPTTVADSDEWLAGEDDQQIQAFEFPRPSTRDDVRRAIDDWSRSWRQLGPVRQWAVCDVASGRILGGVELRDIGDGAVNLSYVVFSFARRRGFATRACRLALVYAAEEMDAKHAMIKVLVENDASLGVARRLNAQEIGRAPSDAGGVFVVFRLALTADKGTA